MGKSYSGAVALQAAVDAPPRVRTLALLEPALLFVPSAARFAEAVAPIVQRYASGDPAGAIEDFMALVWGRDWRVNLEQRVPGGSGQAERDTAVAFEASNARLVTQLVLYLGGTDSGPLFAEIRDLVRAWFPQTEDQMLAGANHSFPITHPTQVADLLATFFARHPLAA